MNFERFAEIHGLIINQLTMDRWVRVPTVDHPHKKNGSYKYVGDAGWVQNHATMEQPIMWRDSYQPTAEEINQRRAKAKDDREERQKKASSKAGYIMKTAVVGKHPYLAKKGFPDEKGYVYNGLLVIPMRVAGNLVGCQLIDESGSKRFLSGQITKGASAVFDNKGVDIVVEGYATALSVRRAMKLLRKRYKIHVAFSANNIPVIANGLQRCLIVADNDPVGIKSAQSTGKPVWFSDTDGEDANDYELRVGTDKFSVVLSARLDEVQVLRRSLEMFG